MDDKTKIEKYKKYFNELYRIAITNTRNEDYASDIVQEVFIKLYTNNKKFDNELHEKYWLIRVTINLCINYKKHWWNTKVDRLEIQEFDRKFYRNQVEKPKEYYKLIEAIEKLSKKFREVLYLYYFERYTTEEISEILNINPSTVRGRLAIGRQKLKELLKPEEEVD